MSCPFWCKLNLGDDRRSVADGGADTGANKYSGGENSGDSGRDVAGDIREHFDFLST
jgi:hypothetical protein